MATTKKDENPDNAVTCVYNWVWVCVCVCSQRPIPTAGSTGTVVCCHFYTALALALSTGD